MTQRTETERVANIGMPVQTDKLGVVKVRELYAEEVLDVAGEILMLLTHLKKPEGEDQEAGTQLLAEVLKDPKLMSAVRSIVAKATDKTPQDYEKMTLKDWLKILAGVKAVFDWEELRQLFMDLLPASALNGLRKIVQGRNFPSSSTSSPPPTDGP